MEASNLNAHQASPESELDDLLALLGKDSNSPSTSIEDSLVQQLDSFEEAKEEQKTTLPPCQVCGGPSSGYVP